MRLDFDEDRDFLNPPGFLPTMSDPYYLDQFRRNKWVLATGEYDVCRAANESFSGQLHHKGIAHGSHVCGYGSKHDWPDWLPIAAAYLP
jgi:esterase/lipase superfamily enzyme